MTLVMGPSDLYHTNSIGNWMLVDFVACIAKVYYFGSVIPIHDKR
jgi:hypothetical protein